MAWTPENLTSTEFVRTQLSPLDRSNALQTMTQNLTRVQSKLAENKAALDQVQDQTNGPYSFGTVRDARNAASAAAAQGDPNAAALQVKYEELLAKRQDLNAQADTLLRAVQSGEDAVRTSTIAISNLEAAGAVPPGTNQFTPPPGYTKVTDTINPPAQVPDSQNPNPKPSTTEESVQNPIALSVNPNSDPNTNIGEEGQDLVYEPLQEPPTTQDEFDGIDAQVAANENTLQEPPQLSDEEVDDYLRQTQEEHIENSEPAQVSEIQGPAYDDEGNLMPGWSLNENNDPVWVGNNADGTVFVEPATRASADSSRAAAATRGLAPKANTQSQAAQRTAQDFAKDGDWRVRLSLAKGANYLYKVPSIAADNILYPLAATDGVIFPYTPSISVSYSASYDNSDLTHSNYKMFQYRSSSVDNISITCDFTAQDTFEANYLLATIHFFRTITKMFYGQDKDPKAGTPPPLVFLTGLGAFQFDKHPLAITSFNYTLPNEVDYIRAGKPSPPAGASTSSSTTTGNAAKPSLLQQVSSVAGRLFGSNLLQGAAAPAPQWKTNAGTVTDPTFVPTKMQIQLTAIPIVTRGDISNNFSVTDYGSGKLYRGSTRAKGGGIW